MCFLCIWTSRDDSNHFTEREWPPKVEHVVGRYNVQHMPLVDPTSVYLPPLYIKLDLMKNFEKAMEVNENGFRYLQNRFCLQ